MTIRRWILALFLMLGSANQAMAQAAQCPLPPNVPAARVLYPPPGETQKVPVSGYVLALSWSPQFCKAKGDDSDYDSQCKVDRPFGFILHGLWPDGNGRKNPQWCRKVEAVPRDVVRQTWCATPSVALQQHEWAKHGSCMPGDAARYFRTARSIYEALIWPDMTALSLRPDLTVGAFKDALAAANPGTAASMYSVGVTPLGWLEEVKLCLGVNLHSQRCPRASEGAGDGAKLRIWRAAR